jgi:chemotaxis protein MotB
VDHKDGPPPEIVIIRRGGRGHDEGHHGGAWKIAYADFMTAMMALFLVMWLIGASDEKTLSQVATYFNPVQLTDRTTTEKGIQDLQQGGTGKETDKKPPKTPELDGSTAPRNKLGKKSPTDEGLFSDPYEVLSKLAGKASKSPLPTSGGGGVREEGDVRAAGGEAFRDPFDPDFRFNSTADGKSSDIKPKSDTVPEQNAGGSGQQEISEGTEKPRALLAAKQEMEAKKAEQGQTGEKPLTGTDAAAVEVKKGELALTGEKSQTGKDAATAEAKKGELALTGEKSQTGKDAAAVEAKKGELALTGEKSHTGKDAATAEARKAELAQAAEKALADKDAAAAEAKVIAIEAKQIEGELKKSIGESGLAKLPEITVEQTPDGVLISVTDQMNFEMFAISSAEPRPELVVVMEKLAKALASQPGRVVVRGHTDGRPFRSKTYDNWRLSSSRAQIAYYMLVRGGLDQQRVERIEGHADRNLKVADDPNAAQNRRIEILLRPAKT